jgi:hypothetical protein
MFKVLEQHTKYTLFFHSHRVEKFSFTNIDYVHNLSFFWGRNTVFQGKVVYILSLALAVYCSSF